ncbi:hypothetical protein ADUPG1_012083, partial [Aduncisulcus paluster]
KTFCQDLRAKIIAGIPSLRFLNYLHISRKERSQAEQKYPKYASFPRELSEAEALILDGKVKQKRMKRLGKEEKEEEKEKEEEVGEEVGEVGEEEAEKVQTKEQKEEEESKKKKRRKKKKKTTTESLELNQNAPDATVSLSSSSFSSSTIGKRRKIDSTMEDDTNQGRKKKSTVSTSTSIPRQLEAKTKNVVNREALEEVALDREEDYPTDADDKTVGGKHWLLASVKKLDDEQQKMLIEGLTYENQILETRLAHETQASKSHSSKDGLQRVSKLRKNKQDLLAQISALGDDVSHHRQMLKDFLGRLNELRKRKSRVSGRKVTDGALERKRKILEGRLEQAITSLNKKLANTKVLRETIENLRKERSFFDRSIRKLQYEEDSTQKRIDEAIDGSNSAYAHREQLHSQLHT